VQRKLGLKIPAVVEILTNQCI